jgi:simple sugar transport system permease protein
MTEEPVAPPVATEVEPDEPPPGRFMRVVYWLTSANTFVTSVLSVFTALVIGAILIVLGNSDVLAKFGYFTAQPGDALSASWDAIATAYKNLFYGAVFDPNATDAAHAFYPLSETLTYAAPLIFTGLAVAFAFRGGLFNIGAQGQAVMGTIGAGLVGFELKLPIVLHVLLALLGGVVFGGIWGLIPGLLKARTGAHEVIVTIMMNYIAGFFLLWVIVQPGVQEPNRTDAISKTTHSSADLTPFFGGDSTLRVHIGLLFGLAVAAVIGWLIKRSTFGFEVRAVGSNPDAAKTAGMSVAKTYTLVMALAGALAGLGGATVLLGTAHALTSQVAGQVGFDGITVALLGRAKPWGVVVASLLFGGLYAGGNRMQSFAGVTIDLVYVLQALIVIFIAAPALIRSIYRLRKARGAGLATNLAKGW